MSASNSSSTRRRIQTGLHAIIPSDEYKDRGSRYNLPGTPFNGLPVLGGNGGNAGVNHILGNMYLSQPLLRNSSYGDITVGVGVFTPFGLETDYQPDWVGRYAALRTKLTTIDIQPTLAWRYNRRGDRNTMFRDLLNEAATRTR